MDSKGSMEIQKEAVKLLEVTIIISYRRRVVQSSRKSMMTDYSQMENAVVVTTIFKMKMQ